MSHTSENSDNNEINWGNVLLGLLALKGVSETKKAVVNSNRRETALAEFEKQDLGMFKSWQMESWFESRDFYVTKFPDTPKDIFPLAVKLLYKLFKYHAKTYSDSWLGQEILHDCEKLQKIAQKNAYFPIAREWDYWKLVQFDEVKENFWGNVKVKRKFFNDPHWNLENFLNDFEAGIIRYGLFGIQSDKRIDVRLYKKKFLGFGELTDAIELDEAEKTIQHVWDVKKQWNWVVKIYDPRKNDTEIPENVEIIINHYCKERNYNHSYRLANLERDSIILSKMGNSNNNVQGDFIYWMDKGKKPKAIILESKGKNHLNHAIEQLEANMRVVQSEGGVVVHCAIMGKKGIENSSKKYNISREKFIIERNNKRPKLIAGKKIYLYFCNNNGSIMKQEMMKINE